jgi:hypothetical protein
VRVGAGRARLAVEDGDLSQDRAGIEVPEHVFAIQLVAVQLDADPAVVDEVAAVAR